jgi:cytoskeleton protein RodZ
MTEIVDFSSEPQSSLNTAPSAGATLKARRVELGYSLDKVSAQLKLTPRQIDAIENERFDELPGNTFVRGFVRNYARFLDLPMAPLLACLEACLPVERQQAALPRVNEDASVLLGGVGHSQSIVLVFVVFAAFALGVGGVFWYLQQPAQPELVASAPMALPKVIVVEEASEVAAVVVAKQAASAVEVASAATVASAVKAASVPVVKASDVVAEPATKGELSVSVQQESWVQVQDATGAKLVSELLKPGVVKSVAGVAPYRLKIGNAPHTQLTFRNQVVDLSTYTRGDVATFELK